jgi:hypothetical protein
MTLDHPQAIADRYAAVWNEADPGARRAAVTALWTADGEHFVGERAWKGHAALIERVTGAYEKNVQGTGHHFRAVRDAQRLRDVLCFHWQMVRTQSDEVLATGLEFLQLDAQGRIRLDHQFIVG